MNIIEFIEAPGMLNDRTLSPAQKMVLKSIYGLALTAEELVLFKQTTGLSDYQPREWSECTMTLGRRAGKSDKLGSNIALYEAVARQHKASRGETPVVMIVASELERQSRIVFRYVLKKLEGSPVLRKMIKRQTSSEIELTNGCLIQVYPAHLGRIRGASLVCFIGDECAYWKSEGKSIDREVIEAARPGLSFEHSKLIKISTPFWQRGEIWNDYKQFYGKVNDHVLVFQGSTELFNPGFSKRKLAAAERRDKVSYETEFLAHFRTDLSGMYDPLVIDKAVDLDRPLELEPRDKLEYAAFTDVAGGGGKDSYAVAIGHLEDSRIVVDVVRSRAPKFNPEDVTRDYSELLKKYRVSTVRGDKFSGDFALHQFAKHQITYERAEKSKSELYLEAEGAFNAEKVGLPNKTIMIEQLKSLVRKVRAGGRDSVDTDSGQSEDEANVLCGLIDLLSARASGAGAAYCGFTEHSVFPDEWGRNEEDENIDFMRREARLRRHDDLMESIARGEARPQKRLGVITTGDVGDKKPERQK
jgi:hypothetical protein